MFETWPSSSMSSGVGVKSRAKSSEQRGGGGRGVGTAGAYRNQRPRPLVDRNVKPRTTSNALVLLLALGVAGCMSPAATGRTPAGKTPAASARGMVRAGTPEGVNIAAARERGRERAFSWEPWGP